LKGEKTLIVETGPTSSIPRLMLGLKELDVGLDEIDYVALSHIHIDHGGGVGTLIKNLPNAKIIVHPKGFQHLKDPTKLWKSSQETLGYVAELFGRPEPVSEERIIVADEGAVFDLGEDLFLRTLGAVGHATHSLGFYEQLNGGLFPGDAAGAYFPEFNAVFPTTPPPFRPDMALVSLEKFIKLKPKVLYYSHFGEASEAVKRLIEYYDLIKMWLNIVQEDLHRGLSSDIIWEHIVCQDENVQRVLADLNANQINRKALIENSLQGFIEFARNPQI
jgi:glyoxylase-like metal-dependent hydrolase (beta-lactamase superfamily II)